MKTIPRVYLSYLVVLQLGQPHLGTVLYLVLEGVSLETLNSISGLGLAVQLAAGNGCSQTFLPRLSLS